MEGLEGQSRRDNLIFYGIPESRGLESEEECRAKVARIMQQNLKIRDTQNRRLVRCHRLGPRRSDINAKPRPVIMKFHWFGDKQMIWKAKKNLKDSGFSMSEDIPKEIVTRRKELLPVMFAAKGMGHEAYLSVDRLHIVFKDGGGHKQYDVSMLNQLPHDLHPHQVSSKRHQKTLAFFTELNRLSNFYPCNLTIDGLEFHSTEQY